jgi:cell division protein FtsW
MAIEAKEWLKMKSLTREINQRSRAVVRTEPLQATEPVPARVAAMRDPVLFWLGAAATLMGLVFVFDAGYARSLRDGYGVVPREFWMQVLYAALGLGAFWVFSRTRAETWQRLARPLWFLTVISLALVLVPAIGFEMNGASRWFKFGPATVQPAEFAKITVVLYLAAVFANRKAWPAKVKAPRSFALKVDTVWIPKVRRAMPAVWVALALLLTELEPDLGTGFIIAVTAFALLWAGGVSRRSLAWCLGLAAFAIFVVVQVQPYRLDRITTHFDRWNPANVDGTAYQTVQSELAMASGGILGVGMGAGRAKHVMPAATTDFVAATIGEEFGFLGWLAAAGVLGALSFRLAVRAQKAPTKFGQLVLLGVGAWIGSQTVVNLMMANGSAPAIGIPLPFISSGGSSLLALWIAMGISQAALAPAKVKQEAPIASDRHGWRDRRTRISCA